MVWCGYKNMFGVLLPSWAFLQYEWIKICSWNQLIIESFDQYLQEIKLENYLKQTRINNSNQMHQYYWSYIIIIVCFQNTTYKFSLDTFQYLFKLIFFDKY